MDLQTLIEFDKQLLLMLNGSESLYLDKLMWTLTNAWTWVPLYISLFYIVLKNNENVQKVLLVVLGAGLCVLLAGTVDDVIVKPTVARWRPTHDPQIGLLVDIVDGYRGGKYGFFSAHAANTFSLAVYFCWLVRSRLLSTTLVIWSLTNCWTRLYLGVHYPGDILVGLLWGAAVGTAAYFIYKRLARRFTTHMNYISTHYTSTGYQRNDADITVSVFVFTLIYAFIRAAI
jgi:undecaprenyl-diphosphatase